MLNLRTVPFGSPEEFNVLIEIPQGSQNKYEFDEKHEAIRLDFVLSGGLTWPANYGSVVGTLGGDGDMLDVFVFSSNPVYPGVLVACKPFGMIEVIDRGETDNKILAVAVVDPRSKYLNDLEDLPEEEVRQFEDFLAELAQQKNKIMEIKGFHGRQRALEELKKSVI